MFSVNGFILIIQYLSELTLVWLWEFSLPLLFSFTVLKSYGILMFYWFCEDGVGWGLFLLPSR